MRLTWWKLSCNREVIHWAVYPPEMHQVTLECLGVYSRKRDSYNVQGVLPLNRLPSMTDAEKNLMMLALRDALAVQMSKNHDIEVAPIKRDLVEWEGAVQNARSG